MRRFIPFTEPLDDNASGVGAGFEIAVIMAAMTLAAGVCSGSITLALMA